MPTLWKCPRCGRTFRQTNQAHSCGTGDRDALLENKPPALAKLFESLESTVLRWKGVEVVSRGRYVLLRTTRIFSDVVFMRDALRVALLLDRDASDPMFFKVGRMSAHRVAHVTLVRTAADLAAVMPYLKEAYAFSIADRPATRASATATPAAPTHARRTRAPARPPRARRR